MSIDQEPLSGGLITPEMRDLQQSIEEFVKRLTESVTDGHCWDCQAFIGVAQLDPKKAEEFLFNELHANPNAQPIDIANLFPDRSELALEDLFRLPCVRKIVG